MVEPNENPPKGTEKRHPSHRKKWLMFLVRWTIAVVGIGWVVANTPLYNKVTIINPADGRPMKVSLARDVPDQVPPTLTIIDPKTGAPKTISRNELVNSPDTKWVMVREPWGLDKERLLALDLSDDLKTVDKFLTENSHGKGQWVMPDRVVNYKLSVPYPLVDQGIVPMVRKANPRYLWLAVLIFPITFILVSIRWDMLLHAVDIHIGIVRAFVITMVGAFYNTFMPGSTGGDVLKAYYAAKLAPGHRTRAVMSVIVDRAIGLIALVILGGTMAAKIAFSPHLAGDAVATRCAQVAAGALLICAGTIIGLAVLYIPFLRKTTGLDFVLKRLPMQAQVEKALHTMELYRRRPLLCIAMLFMTFPVHATVIVSAMFAGMAFGLPLTAAYYWVVVPVVVLAGSIPISPQGAGVMEYFAYLLTNRQGCNPAQAIALAMSIRLVQIFWNLWGGIFVMRGGYHAPTTTEQASVEHDDAPENDQLAQQSVHA